MDSTEGGLEQDSTSDQQGRADGVITVVLTADNHLGYTAFGQPPRKREERQQRLRHAFQQATDFAVGQGVDLFIQAGDLFDTTTPDERDRSFVAERLAQLRQAGIRTFALGGVHDTPADTYSLLGEVAPAPQISYARLGALHYFAPNPVGEESQRDGSSAVASSELEPVMIDVRDMLVGICGLGVLAGQEGNPLMHLRVQSDIERAVISILILHAPLEGLTVGSTLLETRSQVSRSSIASQPWFRYILAGYHHGYQHLHIGHRDVIVAGATQHIDFNDPDDDAGFVFMGLAADGMRWCNHIAVDALALQRLVIHTSELWPDDREGAINRAPTDDPEEGAIDRIPTHDPTDDREGAINRAATEVILERLRPLCSIDAMVQLRLEGTLTRRQYHQLNLNLIRRYGEEHCFALAIDDSGLSLLSIEERFSPREELVALADEWIAAASDEQERKALRTTKEELLSAMDEVRTRR